MVGAWRSQVAHYLGVIGVAGSNPVAPTIRTSTGTNSYEILILVSCARFSISSNAHLMAGVIRGLGGQAHAN